MTTEEATRMIRTDRDFVYLKRYDYSLAKVLDRFPDGAPDRTIAQALMITTEDVERIYLDILSRLRTAMADPTL